MCFLKQVKIAFKTFFCFLEVTYNSLKGDTKITTMIIYSWAINDLKFSRVNSDY